MGGHAVRSSLFLNRVDYHTVSLSHLPDRLSWTPRTFTEAANERFEEMISKEPDAGNEA